MGSNEPGGKSIVRRAQHNSSGSERGKKNLAIKYETLEKRPGKTTPGQSAQGGSLAAGFTSQGDAEREKTPTQMN